MAFKLKKQVKHVDAKWFDFDEETKVLLGSIDNPDYQIALARLRREIQRNDAKFALGEAGVVDGEKTEYQGQCRLMANHVIKDWSGAQDEDGNPLPYTPENAEALLLGNIEVFMFILQTASGYATELREELDEAVEKPSADTSGKGSGADKPKKERPSTPA
ncbi:hypothetical protein M2401_000805 [Pseudomonas sp. JUb42]|uniref:hypothetical protein n=1 Tax=Pseudomonas sp. JUb42 TaxID=2940611 RepID=UPI002169436C|nr:hypothetical protein [Pseudomonas sp. JUb42]MCS3467084.1 hypothetical protein [Pseudomonas sp. JUb42]